MRKYDEYLATIDTIYPDRYEREGVSHVIGNLLPAAAMPVRAGMLAGLIDRCGNWISRRSGRKALLDMSAEQLRDIGVTRIGARSEASKSRFLI